MAFKPLAWYCRRRRIKYGGCLWIMHLVHTHQMPRHDPDVGISYLVLLLCCVYRIWSTKNDFSVKRYRLRSSYYNYLLDILVFYCTTEPLIKLFMGLSIENLDGQCS
ncbi:ABC transporter C family member 1 [Platanthera guangdongensis]|uniref:ABC transporter C family member 1 n=1 Tax=Platanthera guangdongensis TaxID=2320717 RepID=A0ABR2LV24_9ASPA